MRNRGENMQDTQISSAEWEVMRVVWASEHSTSKEIIEVLERKMEWKPATTKTLIGRLVKKGVLNTDKQGHKFIYSSVLKEAVYVQKASQELLSKICTKKVGKTIALMVEDNTISQKDIEKLEMLLQEKKANAPEEVACQCIQGQCACHIEGGEHF